MLYSKQKKIFKTLIPIIMKTIQFIFLTLLVAFSLNTASATIAKVELTKDQAKQEIASMKSQGFIPTYIDGFRDPVGDNMASKLYFNVIFSKVSNASHYKAIVGMSPAAYQTVYNQLVGTYNMHLTFLESYQNASGSVEYAAVFKAGPAPVQSYVNVSQAAHQNSFNNLTAQGYRLVCRTTVPTNAGPRVSALYDKANVGSWLATSSGTMAQAETKIDQNKAAGRTLAHFDPMYSQVGMIFDSKPNQGWYFKSNLTKYQAGVQLSIAKGNGYKPTVVSGYTTSTLINGNVSYTKRYAIVFVKPSVVSVGGRTGTLTLKR